MRILVLGGGAQGSATAFDLAQREIVDEVIVADQDVTCPPSFLEPLLEGKLSLLALDASDERAVREAMTGVDAVACALPYYFNLPMTRLAIESGAHFCDLGGNTAIVGAQRELDGEARARGVTVVPDCGLAPGMVNILAQAGIDSLDATDSVRIWVGGLPQNPKPPLNYQIVYSMEGVLDYYTTDAVVLEDGEPMTVHALDGLECVTFPDPVGELEAFHTGGGISTMPFRYRGKIRSMAYKTLRYPGHAGIMKAIRELGLLGDQPVDVDGTTVVPRDVFIACAAPRLRNPKGNDIVAMRVEVQGERDGSPRGIRFDLLDHYDAETGITAMMRTTGFSLAITARLQAEGKIPSGVATPDECMPAREYIRDLASRRVMIERSEF